MPFVINNYALLGIILFSLSTAIMGCFLVLQKKSLLGDAVAHALMPGICLGFLYSGKSPFYLLAGALLAGMLALVAIDYIPMYSKLKPDTVMASILSIFFGLGLLLLSIIQKSNGQAYASLKQFLLGGRAATLLQEDVAKFGFIAILIMSLVGLFFESLKLITFDPNFAQAIGWPVKRLRLLLNTLTIIAIALGAQVVGVVLMTTMLITPASAACFWTHRLSTIVPLAACLSALAAGLGTWCSSTVPSVPTGASIVLFMSSITLLSSLFAPGTGFCSIWWKRYQQQNKILADNILKALLRLSQQQPSKSGYKLQELAKKCKMSNRKLQHNLFRLQRHSLVHRIGNQWSLSERGKKRGVYVLRCHQLWKKYLHHYLNIRPDHVHEDAEAMEHWIDPTTRKALERLVDKKEAS